jgi:hypothetical protein
VAEKICTLDNFVAEMGDYRRKYKNMIATNGEEGKN